MNSQRILEKVNRDQIFHKSRSSDHIIKFYPKQKIKYKKYHHNKEKEIRRDQLISINRMKFNMKQTKLEDLGNEDILDLMSYFD